MCFHLVKDSCLAGQTRRERQQSMFPQQVVLRFGEVELILPASVSSTDRSRLLMCNKYILMDSHNIYTRAATFTIKITFLPH